MSKEQTPSAEMQKLLGRMEANAIWGRANYREKTGGRIAAERELQILSYIRTLEAENQKLREENMSLRKQLHHN